MAIRSAVDEKDLGSREGRKEGKVPSQHCDAWHAPRLHAVFDALEIGFWAFAEQSNELQNTSVKTKTKVGKVMHWFYLSSITQYKMGGCFLMLLRKTRNLSNIIPPFERKDGKKEKWKRATFVHKAWMRAEFFCLCNEGAAPFGSPHQEYRVYTSSIQTPLDIPSHFRFIMRPHNNKGDERQMHFLIFV